MSNKPLLSVLMTAYNRERYIAEAINSVITSTYLNWELIIVDDQSTDDTLKIAESFQKKDNRIKVFLNEKNLGDYPNRMKAAGYAKGKYIKYLDSDDYIYPHGLELMVESMEKFPNAGIGFHDHLYDGKKQMPYQLLPAEAYFKHYFGGSLLIQGPSAAIYKRDFFEKIGGFEIKYGVATDGAFNLKAAMTSPIVIFNRDLFWWRPHDGQEFNKLQDKYELLNDQLNEYFLSHTHCPLEKELAATAYLNLKNIIVRRTIISILKGNFRIAIQRKRNFKINFYLTLFSFLPSSIRRKFQKQSLKND